MIVLSLQWCKTESMLAVSFLSYYVWLHRLEFKLC